MSDLDRIVQITITRQTTVPSLQSFNDLLIAFEETTNPMASKVTEYGTLAEVELDFADTTEVYKCANIIFSQNPRVNRIFVGWKETTETWAAELTLMKQTNSFWYGLIPVLGAYDATVITPQTDISTWTEANNKLCIHQSSDPNCLDSTSITDIMYLLNNLNFDRSAVIYHDDPTTYYAHGAWMGKQFVQQPGSTTWMFKSLNGVPTYDIDTASQSAVLNKEGNMYTSVADVPITQNGTVASGEYIDVIHFIDWLEAYIQNQIFTPLVQQQKVPFTDAGIESVVASLKSALDRGITVGGIESYTTSAPLASEVSSVDKAARTLPDVEFEAVLAGAIHKVVVNGVVTL